MKSDSEVQPAKRNRQTRKQKKHRQEQELLGIKGLVLEKCSQRSGVPLRALVDELKAELPDCDTDGILGMLMELNSKGKISIAERRPYATFASYAFSPKSTWLWASIAATVASLTLVSVTSGLGLYLRYVFGALLVIFLPGYSLIELLYAKKKELDDLTRVALSIGLSLCIVVLVELALNYTPFGLGLVPGALTIAILTLILLFIGAKRKYSYYRLANGIF